ncbi:Alpha-1,6-mannosyl-glycoprotein 2-beta-N-acetylglucosaminyltransferase [Homalodisca vitripennis]|nr:Alpha-1,6-mannosyl-glycoprotein 2-beta-N-acetylglucosaminyltransferase [Homalodisca vitripennis]
MKKCVMSAGRHEARTDCQGHFPDSPNFPLARGLNLGLKVVCSCYAGGRTVRVVVTPPALGRRRTASCLRTVIFLFLVTFVWLQLHMSSLSSSPRPDLSADNDSSQAILSMVPQVLHKFLTSRPRNVSQHLASNASELPRALTIDEIKHNIRRYNQLQTVHNEDLFGPVQNDTIIIVIQYQNCSPKIKGEARCLEAASDPALIKKYCAEGTFEATLMIEKISKRYFLDLRSRPRLSNFYDVRSRWESTDRKCSWPSVWALVVCTPGEKRKTSLEIVHKFKLISCKRFTASASSIDNDNNHWLTFLLKIIVEISLKKLKFGNCLLIFIKSTLSSQSRHGQHALISSLATALKLGSPNNSNRCPPQLTRHIDLSFYPNISIFAIHTRLVYLRHLIVSLAQARDIESTLIVFSHDYYDEEINDLVQSVDFAKVLQIFYPHSIQTHPHEFPGESPGDCPRDITIEQAAIRKCINARTPDLYGHYREAKFTQTKHHWWWKANRVFNQLEITRNHTGLVLFLEEDHFVAQDFLHILRLMERTARVSCPTCNILSLGTYLKTYSYFGDSKKKEALRAMKRHQTLSAAAIPPSWTFQVLPSLYQHYQKSPFHTRHIQMFTLVQAEVTPWVSSKHNMGFALNRSVWLEMWSCARYFCSYDDYNWDWSLQHVSQSCLPHKLVAMVMRGPRVFHIGECGVHHKKTNCESTSVISKVQKVLANAARHLYPTHLTLTFTSGTKKHKLRKGNGGWGDIRDHQLCFNMTLLTPAR